MDRYNFFECSTSKLFKKPLTEKTDSKTNRGLLISPLLK